MKKDYDIIEHRTFNNAIIDYGIIKGNNTMVLIKAGLDGSMYGYNNKYLRMAESINNNYGYTIICSSNPSCTEDPLQDAMEMINDYCKKENYSEYTIYYMGYSNGGLHGAWYGYKYPLIRRMILVNAPLMFNWHKTKDGIKQYSGEKLTLIYGSQDQSIGFVDLLKPLLNDKVKLEIIDGENHLFSNGKYDFIKLPEDYLL